MYKIVSVVLALLTIAANSHAVPLRPTKYLLVNGVWNFGAFDARVRADELTIAMREANIDLLGKVELIHNPGDGYIVDVLEIIANARKAGLPLNSLGDGPQSLITVALNSYITRTRINFDEVINKVADTAASHLKNGNPVHLIGHSQGTLVVNEAIRRLRKQGQGIFGVEDVAALNIGSIDSGPYPKHYDYLTKNSDLIVFATPGSPPGNFPDQSGEEKSFLSHDLEEYLKGRSGQTIIEKIRKTSDLLSSSYWSPKIYRNSLVLDGTVRFLEDGCGIRAVHSTGYINATIEPKNWPPQLDITLDLTSYGSAGSGLNCSAATWTNSSVPLMIVGMTAPYISGFSIPKIMFSTPNRDEIIARGYTFVDVQGDFARFDGHIEQFDRYLRGQHIGSTSGLISLLPTQN